MPVEIRRAFLGWGGVEGSGSLRLTRFPGGADGEPGTALWKARLS